MIPDFLIAQDRWVLWRNVKRGNKHTKEPVAYRTGRAAAVNRPGDWTDYPSIQKALSVGAWDGPGIVLGDLGCGEILAGIDLDASLDEDGALADWAKPFLAVLDSYCEVSPSGGGLKLFFRLRADDLPAIRHCLALADDEHGRKRTFGAATNGHDHAPAAEVYLARRYFTVTGRPWHSSAEDIRLVTADQLAQVAELLGPRVRPGGPGAAPTDHTAPDQAGLRAKLAAALGRSERIRLRWLGATAGLNDTTRSGFDMSLGAMLKGAGFSFAEMRAALIENPHGAGCEHSEDDRYFERIWQRSVAQEPPPPDRPPLGDDTAPDHGDESHGATAEDEELRIELWSRLGLADWLARRIEPPERLLGDLITSGSRTFLVGRTGLGKTLVAYGLAFGMTSGQGFLHWRAARACNVLIIDGEMPPELIQRRLRGESERVGDAATPGALLCYSRLDGERFAGQFPVLGRMEPLNTESGMNWLMALIRHLGAGLDVVFFDNVMSLLIGDQKDELSWSGVLPLIDAISTLGLAQVWLDHTGHAGDRQYGSATKSWRFDNVGIMTPLPDGSLTAGEMGLILSFDHPGKARQRTPENYLDFAPVAIRLRQGAWTGEPADAMRAAGERAKLREKLKPRSYKFYSALQDAIIGSTLFHEHRTTIAAWKAEATRRGLMERDDDPADSWAIRARKGSAFRNAKANLIAAEWIGIDGETVNDLARPRLR